MPTIYATHPRYADHDMRGYQHPEHSGRIQAVWEQITDSGLKERLQTLTPQPATDEQILRAHTQSHLATLKDVAAQDTMSMFDADTYALPDSPEIARLAAGAVTEAVDAICSGAADNGLAAVRPPGHHATPTRAMGFCLLNNIAIGARHVQAAHEAIERVLIVDVDVHHGNGTQDIFYDDDSVLFISTHQAPPFYPNSGAEADTGTGSGKGTTLNIPLPPGVGDAGYQMLYEKLVWPAVERFQPDLLLVSAGFDAHFVDPLAQMKLSLPGYAHRCRELQAMADKFCAGRVLFVMEGGYDLQAIGHGMRNIAHVLLNDDTISDPYGTHDTDEPDLTALVERLQSRHNL